MDCVLVYEEMHQGEDYVHVARSLEDAFPAVRWKAMMTLARAGSMHLDRARKILQSEGANEDAQGVAFVLNPIQQAAAIEAALQSESGLLRRYAGVACARCAPHGPDITEKARVSGDEEIRTFLDDWMCSS